MIAAVLATMLCLTPPAGATTPYTIQVYSVRVDGAGHACDCHLAPCGQRAGTCYDPERDTNGPCAPLLEPGCNNNVPDECGNMGPCAYLSMRDYPGAMVWRLYGMSADGCFDTVHQEISRVGWMTWWRIKP